VAEGRGTVNQWQHVPSLAGSAACQHIGWQGAAAASCTAWQLPVASALFRPVKAEWPCHSG
jgi:hypothetical protein